METQTVMILRSFLDARKGTVERVQETINDRELTITTFMSYNTDAGLLVEDIVTEARR